MKALDVEHQAVRRAAIWLRDAHQISEYQSILDLFEQEFKCRVRVSRRTGFANKIIFESEELCAWFVLKWS